MNQLEVNLCRVEIAEPRAAIKSHRTNRQVKGGQAEGNALAHVRSLRLESEAALF